MSFFGRRLVLAGAQQELFRSSSGAGAGAGAGAVCEGCCFLAECVFAWVFAPGMIQLGCCSSEEKKAKRSENARPVRFIENTKRAGNNGNEATEERGTRNMMMPMS